MVYSRSYSARQDYTSRHLGDDVPEEKRRRSSVSIFCRHAHDNRQAWRETRRQECFGTAPQLLLEVSRKTIMELSIALKNNRVSCFRSTPDIDRQELGRLENYHDVTTNSMRPVKKTIVC